MVLQPGPGLTQMIHSQGLAKKMVWIVTPSYLPETLVLASDVSSQTQPDIGGEAGGEEGGRGPTTTQNQSCYLTPHHKGQKWPKSPVDDRATPR